MPVPLVLGGFWVALQTWAFIALPALVVRVLISLGIGVATYTGADFVISEAENYVLSSFSGFPVKVYSVMALAGLDQGLRIMFAAASAYISIRTVLGAFSFFKADPNVLRA